MSPVRELDWKGNEIHYRSMSERDFEKFRITGEMPSTGETSVSPMRDYAESYRGVTVRIATQPGTSERLQQIGVAANEPAAAAFPEMPIEAPNWTQTSARFKFESGQMTTQLGRGDALKIYNDNIVSAKPIRQGN
jgi:filamentous hemagglutinin